MKNLAFIDPAVFVWDVDDFQQRQESYWSLAADTIDLISMIEDMGIRPVARQDLLDELLLSFPAEHLDHGKYELRDFSTVVYGFIAKIGEYEDRYDEGVVDGCLPDIRARPHFGDRIRSEINSLLKFVSNHNNEFVVFSHECVVGGKRLTISVDVDAKIVEFDCLASLDNYIKYKADLTPVYEEHVKHDSLYGYGSKLPPTLTGDDLQELLIAAAPIDLQKSVCVYSNKVNQYIQFRRHVGNLYHAYPIGCNELSRIGVNPNDVLHA